MKRSIYFHCLCISCALMMRTTEGQGIIESLKQLIKNHQAQLGNIPQAQLGNIPQAQLGNIPQAQIGSMPMPFNGPGVLVPIRQVFPFYPLMPNMHSKDNSNTETIKSPESSLDGTGQGLNKENDGGEGDEETDDVGDGSGDEGDGSGDVGDGSGDGGDGGGGQDVDGNGGKNEEDTNGGTANTKTQPSMCGLIYGLGFRCFRLIRPMHGKSDGGSNTNGKTIKLPKCRVINGIRWCMRPVGPAMPVISGVKRKWIPYRALPPRPPPVPQCIHHNGVLKCLRRIVHTGFGPLRQMFPQFGFRTFKGRK